MLDKDILCATDLTPTSDHAVRAAVLVAGRINVQITMLHVLMKQERTNEGKDQVLEAMRAQATKADGTGRVAFKLLEGDFMKRIAEETANDHSLMVLGTHGPRGLRQKLFGADILKLVRHSSIPSLVVQDRTDTEQLFERIVLPVAAHSDIDRLLDLVCALGKAFASEVHLYQLMRPMEEPSEELLANRAKMLERLKRESLRYIEVNEPSTTFSIGFAEPTIRYAERIGAGCIAIMSRASDEYRYIADAEKERLLANDASIPVLCI
ncbi:MAG: universal stress protein [Flavobacteriales bacterium]|nr:universal stress protein [Flavobacteriales bacterium]